jgi:hypothetical protein
MQSGIRIEKDDGIYCVWEEGLIGLGEISRHVPHVILGITASVVTKPGDSAD